MREKYAAKLQHFFYSRKYFIKKIRFFVFFLLFALYVLHFLSRHLGSNDFFGRIFAAAFASVLARGVGGLPRRCPHSTCERFDPRVRHTRVIRNPTSLSP